MHNKWSLPAWKRCDHRGERGVVLHNFPPLSYLAYSRLSCAPHHRTLTQPCDICLHVDILFCQFPKYRGRKCFMRTPLVFSRPPTVVLSGSISVSAHLDSTASADINIYILESGQEILAGSWMLNLFVIFCCCLCVCTLFPSQLFL